MPTENLFFNEILLNIFEIEIFSNSTSWFLPRGCFDLPAEKTHFSVKSYWIFWKLKFSNSTSRFCTQGNCFDLPTDNLCFKEILFKYLLIFSNRTSWFWTQRTGFEYRPVKTYFSMKFYWMFIETKIFQQCLLILSLKSCFDLLVENLFFSEI